MVNDCARHGGMLPVGNSKLLGGLLHDPRERGIVRVAHVGTKVMGDVMIQPAYEPTYERVFRRIIRGCREASKMMLDETLLAPLKSACLGRRHAHL